MVFDPSVITWLVELLLCTYQNIVVCSSFTIFNSVSISKTLCIVCRHLPQQMPVLASCEEGAPRGIGTTFKRLLQSGTARKRKASGENTVLPHATFEAVT